MLVNGKIGMSSPFLLRYHFLFSRYLNVYLGFLVMQKDGLIRKIEFNFKIYNVKTSEKNHCNTHIAQYLMK